MAEDWALDVKKFAPSADDTVIAGIVRYCGIALQNRDSSLVSLNDPVETARVRDNFLKKKLGLTQPDDVLDQAIAAVGERMKGVNFKNRVTVYYLLLEHFGLLHLFGKAGAGAAAAGADAAALGVAGLASVPDGDRAPAAAPGVAPEPVVRAAAAPIASQTLTGAPVGGAKSGFGWWPWLLVALLLLALLWWFFFRTPAVTPEARTAAVGNDIVASAPATVAPPAAPGGAGALSAAPAEGTVAIPTGAGVTTETRDGKPVVKVYFDTGKTDVAPAFTDAATGLKAYLDSHSGSTLAVSGFNDKTGNVAANAELSKNRAQAVKAALVSTGVPETAVELVKPADTTDASGSNAEARRVEVVVR